MIIFALVLAGCSFLITVGNLFHLLEIQRRLDALEEELDGDDDPNDLERNV